MRVIFSIGLNVGSSEPKFQLSRTMIECGYMAGVHDVALGQAEWQGVPERFVQVAMPIETPRSAHDVAGRLARILKQDAVGVLLPHAAKWVLVDQDYNASEGGTLEEFPCLLPRGDHDPEEVNHA